MASPTAVEYATQLFQKQWVATVPSHPTLKFFRPTVEQVDLVIASLANPENYEHEPSFKPWDESMKAGYKERFTKRTQSSNTSFEQLVVLVACEGKIIGCGGIGKLPDTGHHNVGIALAKEARGKGIGKVNMQVLAQIGLEYAEVLEAGTMKSNTPMRALMRSLGIDEREEEKRLPNGDLVAELLYDIKREDWKWIGMKLDFDTKSVALLEDEIAGAIEKKISSD
jgi:RimJ/RimL family protein N-acetyltransferase